MKNIMVLLCNEASHVFDIFFSYSIVLRRARFNFITPTRARHNPQSQVIMYIICTLKCMHYEGNLQITFYTI